jgi:Domain of unknown function (DUF4382)
MQLRKIFPLLAAAALAATGCSNAKKSSNLSVSTKGASNGALVSGALQITPTLSVSRVQVAVRDIELEPVEAAPGTGSAMPMSAVAEHGTGDDDEHGEGEVEVGPFFIDLSGSKLAGPTSVAFDAQVPAGTYREMRIRVRPLSLAEAAQAVDKGADSSVVDLSRAEDSVAIDGTAGTGSTAASFHLAFNIRARVKKETALVIDAGTTNVTVPIDVAAWFAGVDDPTAAGAQATIAANIAAALDVFVDEDENGEDDAGEHGGNGGGDHGGGGQGGDGAR